MTDIVERLRHQYNEWNNPPSPELPEGAEVVLEAAAEIERLRAALRRLGKDRMPSDVLDNARAAMERKDG